MNSVLDTTGIRYIKRLDRFQARVQTKDKDVSKCFNTQEEALNWRNSQTSPVGAVVIKQEELCAALFEKWLVSPFVKYSKQTIFLYREAVRVHFGLFHSLKPDQVTPEIVFQWVQDLREKPTTRHTVRSIKTIKNLLSALTAFLDWCALKSMIETNPARDHKMREKLDRIFQLDRLSKNRVSEIRKKSLTPLDTQKLLQEAYKRGFQTGFAIEFFIHTAMRLGEVSAINWDDIIQNGGVILASITKTRCHRTLQVQNSAKCGSDGNVELPSTIVCKLVEWKKRALEAGYEVASGQPIFPFVAKNPHQFSKVIRELGKRCGIRKPISAHCLRHTAITLMVLAGIPLHVVQRIARHKSAAMTEGYFAAHLVPVTGATESIGKYLNSVSQNEAQVPLSPTFLPISFPTLST